MADEEVARPAHDVDMGLLSDASVATEQHHGFKVGDWLQRLMDLVTGAQRDWVAQDLRKAGVEDPEKLLEARPELVQKHMDNYREACDRIRALGGTPPTLEELRDEPLPANAVLRKLESGLKRMKARPAAAPITG